MNSVHSIKLNDSPDKKIKLQSEYLSNNVTTEYKNKELVGISPIKNNEVVTKEEYNTVSNVNSKSDLSKCSY